MHVIDLGRRLSSCVVVSDKEAPTVVRALLSNWIWAYGACLIILSDTRREFRYCLMRLLVELNNIRAEVT